jgi:hypothetical protein
MMKIVEQRMMCHCGHVFEAELVLDAPVALAVASMKFVRCPKCHSKKVYLGGGYSDAPLLTASINERAQWWRARGDCGTSSVTIWCSMTGERHATYHWPLDPDDFRRCKKLLDLIPEWRKDLKKVVDRFQWFKPFADRWGEFELLYEKESQFGRAQKLYHEMQKACVEAETIAQQLRVAQP